MPECCVLGVWSRLRRQQLEKHFEGVPSACAPPLGASHFLQKVPRYSTPKWSPHGRCAAPLPPELRPNPTSRAPYAAQLAVVAHLSWLAAPRGSSPPSLTRAPLADRLAPATPHDRPLCLLPEPSRATPLPSATSPTPSAAITRRPPPNGPPPPVGDSRIRQILWSLIIHRSVCSILEWIHPY